MPARIADGAYVLDSDEIVKTVERLSARMRGAAAVTPHQELAALLTRWTELAPPASADLEERLRRGLAAATETLP